MIQVRALKLADFDFGQKWSEEVDDRWEYEDFKNRPDWRKGWISFDCAYYDSAGRRVYLGISSFDSDIFKAYDCETGKFQDLGYRKVADCFDAKFHRSLIRGRNGCLYAAVALLHDVDHFFDAPGGAIVRYDPQTGALAKVAIPSPNIYIQAICLDHDRDLIYCLCFPPEKLLSYNLTTGETRDLGMIGSGIGGMVQSENLILDDEDCVWSGWGLTRAWQYSPGADSHRLCKYDPRSQRIVFFKSGLPKPDGTYGTSRVESFFNFHDGFVYASGANGSLFRIDPSSGEAIWLFTPTPDRPSRLSSLAKTEDGAAYGVTGRDGNCEFMRVNYRLGKFEKLGRVKDESGTALWQCHDIVYTGRGVFYACENDNPHRSSYLWEITI